MDKPLRKIIGNQLKQCRMSQGLKQNEVAKKIGICRQALSNYESGRYMPTVDILLQLADLYGCTTDFLLGRDNVNDCRLVVDDIQNMAFEKQKQIMIYELRRFIREEWKVEL